MVRNSQKMPAMRNNKKESNLRVMFLKVTFGVKKAKQNETKSKLSKQRLNKSAGDVVSLSSEKQNKYSKNGY